MKGKDVFIILTALFVVLACGQASADEVWLKNGDRLTGKVVSLDSGLLVFKTSYAGDLSIKWEEVVNLKTDEPIKVVLGDETTVQGPVSPGDSGKVKVKAEQVTEPVTIDLANVKVINPKPPLTTTLRINVGASMNSGNTDNQDFYGQLDFIARTAMNRFSVGGNYQRSEDNNVKTADNALGYIKYDHFLSKKWYLYANATGQQDDFQDLNLRTTLGIGAGYQFFESERTNLSLEGGLSYVNEDFTIAPDNSYAAGRWGLKFDYYILPKSLQFFVYHTGLQSLESSDDLLLYTQTGFRIPFYKDFNLALQMNWQYDKSPAPGREKNDYTYILSLGYLWAN
jgi:putative salt-induced outer membrane protein YdiY